MKEVPLVMEAYLSNLYNPNLPPAPTQMADKLIPAHVVLLCVCLCVMHYLFSRVNQAHERARLPFSKVNLSFSKTCFCCHFFKFSICDLLNTFENLFTHGFCLIWDALCCSFLDFEVWSLSLPKVDVCGTLKISLVTVCNFRKKKVFELWWYYG